MPLAPSPQPVIVRLYHLNPDDIIRTASGTQTLTLQVIDPLKGQIMLLEQNGLSLVSPGFMPVYGLIGSTLDSNQGNTEPADPRFRMALVENQRYIIKTATGPRVVGPPATHISVNGRSVVAQRDLVAA